VSFLVAFHQKYESTMSLVGIFQHTRYEN